MKNSTLFILLIFFCISEKPLQASDCGLARFDILQKLKPLATSVEIYDFKIQKEEVQSKINDIEEQLKLIPVNLSVSTSNSQNFEGLEQNKQISEQKNSIDLSYNLNRIKLNNTNEQLKIRKLLLELQLDELKAREAVNVYKGLLEYIMSMELNSYFQTEKRFYQIKKDYFNERKEFGDLNLDNLLKVEKEIRNISDKILANSVKQIESLNQLNISEEFIPKQLALSTSKINVLADNCRFKPLFLERYSIEKKLSKQKLNSLSRINASQFSLSLQLSDRYSSNAYQNNLGASIELKIPLYDGGILDSQKKQLLSESKIIDAEIRIEKEKFETSIASRLSTERVFAESFKSIVREISAMEFTSSELKSRQNMGQGVFEERINNNLQILTLQQAKLRLINDFLLGWVRFLETVQDGLE